MIEHDAVKKFHNYMNQHNDRLPLLSVESTDTKRFVELRKVLAHIYGDIDNDVWSVGKHLRQLVDDLSSMNHYDRDKIVYCVKKYQIKGQSGGVTGQRTYGYDRSRVDGALIRRKRGN